MVMRYDSGFYPDENNEILQEGKKPSGVRAKASVMRKKSKEAFRTISEVADLLAVQQHVLRFWETKFTQVKPLKRGGGRRYYRPEDVALLQAIQHLLYTEGYTIKGVQKLLKTQGRKRFVESLMGAQIHVPEASNLVSDMTPSENAKPLQPSIDESTNDFEDAPSVNASLNESQKEALQAMLAELKSLRDLVNS